ncbi:MAG: hypothetical protein J0I08_12085 [Rhizobiales bacterium]|nr:hypothetical protein [Hyphomicrobiales bacterium]
MKKTTASASHATAVVAKNAIKMSASFLEAQGAAGAATLAFGRLLGAVTPVFLAVTVVRDAFKLMAYSTELAKAKIEEFHKVTEEANASGFSTEFFQRITKSGGQARDKVDDLTESLKKFNAESTPKLGGSGLQNRLDELTKAGNFRGNSGIGALAGANDSEGRLRAVVALIDQAMQKGERLAAIDLADRAFGPKVAAALRADSGYLDDMLKRADAIKKTELISQEDLGRAEELRRRMDDAQKVLADKWKPVQDDLAKLGMNYHESWVNITEDLAAAVGYATSLYQALKQVPDWFANRVGNASVWKSLTDATGAAGLNSRPADLVMKDEPGFGQTEANKKLAAALQNYQNVTRAMREATDVSSAVRKDTSKAPGQDQVAEANAFDRATDAIGKHIGRLQADTNAVGLGTAAQVQLRAEAMLTTAAMQAYGTVSADTATKVKDMAARVGEAAQALEKAKVAAAIDFGRKTAFLSDTDVNIARQLAGIYGNDVAKALSSVEGSAVRVNNSLRTANDETAACGKEAK